MGIENMDVDKKLEVLSKYTRVELLNIGDWPNSQKKDLLSKLEKHNNVKPRFGKFDLWGILN